MKRWRFKFSKVLDESVDLDMLRAYIDEVTIEQNRHAARMKELREREEDLHAALCRKHGAPRDLTYVVDPSHLTEHGLAVLFSRETEEYDDGRHTPAGDTIQ